MNLRQRVEDRTRRLVEEQRPPHLEGALQHCFRTRQGAEMDADLAERRERHGEPVPGGELFVKCDAALGQSERLVVAVPHHRDVGLVAADDREDIIRVHGRREAFGLAHLGECFVVASRLRERAAGERVHEGQVASIADSVECGGGLAEMLLHRRRVAQLLVTACQLEVGQPDGARVVRLLAMPQGPAVERDPARLFAACGGYTAVQPPEVREQHGRSRFPERVGCTAERSARLLDVVLQQPRLREGGPDGQLVFAGDGGRAQGLREVLCGPCGVATLQGRLRASHDRLKGDADHRRSIHACSQQPAAPARVEPGAGVASAG